MTLIPVLSEAEIRNRIRALSEEIATNYCSANPLLLGVLKGSLHFLSDLSRSLPFPHEIDFLRVDTYRGTVAERGSRVEHFRTLDVMGRDILIVDEILDQGHTAKAIRDFFAGRGAKSIEWVFLLVKEGAPDRVGLDPRYIGFEIGPEWVVGYGMDLDEQYRHLNSIYRWAPESCED